MKAAFFIVFAFPLLLMNDMIKNTVRNGSGENEEGN
jgi:hypothetical protein